MAERAGAPATPPIPERVLDKPPSAELRPDQKDTDSLPPYEVLDPVIEAYVEEDRSPEDIDRRRGLDRDAGRPRGRDDRPGRVQAPPGARPGMKITPKAFGRDRRMPITNRYRRFRSP